MVQFGPSSMAIEMFANGAHHDLKTEIQVKGVCTTKVSYFTVTIKIQTISYSMRTVLTFSVKNKKVYSGYCKTLVKTSSQPGLQYDPMKIYQALSKSYQSQADQELSKSYQSQADQARSKSYHSQAEQALSKSYQSQAGRSSTV